MRPSYMSALLFTLLVSYICAQSVDEEAYVHVAEGSGRYSSDDEDIEGSSLPRDANYATTPVVHPRLTQGPATRWKTNTMKYPTIIQTQWVTTFATSTPRVGIETTEGDRAASQQTLSPNIILLIVGLLVFIVIIVVIAVCCFKCCISKFLSSFFKSVNNHSNQEILHITENG
ncbi:hypothetical protein ANCCAN_11752 [Ancylostoma caninum]|uniref:Uncharacterized protein n=1 Tax=Ancylostoma caninum TaxID=29170 RepID=A0A368GHD6_ANCCA|nr:hypothetical protein ANCCAN_11752 [Ancylostoma caninum]